MSVVSVVEQSMERRGKLTPEGRTSTRIFLVTTDDPETGEAAIYDHAGIPNMFNEHPNDETILCQEVSPETYEDRLHWTVTCLYRPRKSDTSAPGTSVVRATDLPPAVSYSHAPYTKVIDKAYDSEDTQGSPSLPVENSAEMPFDPPVAQEEGNLVIRIVRNETEREFQPNVMANYINTINKDALSIAGVKIAPNEGRMRDIIGTRTWDADNVEYYFTVTYDIEVDRKTHIRKVLDQGYYTKAEGEDPAVINDKDGDPITEPRKLDGSGDLLADGEDAVYRSYQSYFARRWTGLYLPISKASKFKRG